MIFVKHCNNLSADVLLRQSTAVAAHPREQVPSSTVFLDNVNGLIILKASNKVHHSWPSACKSKNVAAYVSAAMTPDFGVLRTAAQKCGVEMHRAMH